MGRLHRWPDTAWIWGGAFVVWECRCRVVHFCLAGQPMLSCLIQWELTGNETIIWAPSSEFVSSSIPSWQILTAHAQPFRRAKDLAFCLKIPLDSLLVWASSEGSGETARMRRLAWTFAAGIADKYKIRLTRSIWDIHLIRFAGKSRQTNSNST